MPETPATAKYCTTGAISDLNNLTLTLVAITPNIAPNAPPAKSSKIGQPAHTN